MVDALDAVLLGHRADDVDQGAADERARLPAALRRIDAATIGVDPAAAGRRASTWLSGVGEGVWLHLDLDVLDPQSLPAVTYPQPGGLDWDQLAVLIDPLAQAPQLIGPSIADFRPDLDPTGDLAAQVLDVLAQVLR